MYAVYHWTCHAIFLPFFLLCIPTFVYSGARLKSLSLLLARGSWEGHGIKKRGPFLLFPVGFWNPIIFPNWIWIFLMYQIWKSIPFQKLFSDTVLVFTKKLKILGLQPRISKVFSITRTIHSNSERSEQFVVTECFFNLFLEVSQI